MINALLENSKFTHSNKAIRNVTFSLLKTISVALQMKVGDSLLKKLSSLKKNGLQT